MWQGCVGRKCGYVGGERAAVMCRQGYGRVGGVVAGGARVVVVPCVVCEMRVDEGQQERGAVAGGRSLRRVWVA